LGTLMGYMHVLVYTNGAVLGTWGPCGCVG
jgi:hypothetical protein